MNPYASSTWLPGYNPPLFQTMEYKMHQFIDGRYREGRGDEAKRINPATGEPAETIRYAATNDVDDAVAAAKRAFGTWSRCTPAAMMSTSPRGCGDFARHACRCFASSSAPSR